MLVEQIKEIVKECSRIMLSAHDVEQTITVKPGSANFVTYFDKKVQDTLQEKLSELLPEASFLGEEDEVHTFTNKGYLFIIDPIDGTTNFIKNYKTSCISVGLAKDGEMYIGVVYNPYLDEMFWAKRGSGAFCNGRPLQSSEKTLSEGLVLLGSAPYYPELTDATFSLARHFFDKALDLRRSGSAAIDLCNMAAGRAELYFEAKLSPWDFAAGSLIVEEAGGKVSTFDDVPVTLHAPCSVLCVGAGEKAHMNVLCKEIHEVLAYK